jgi:hypothetical protein
MKRLHAVRSWCEQHAVILLLLIALVLVRGIALRGVELQMDKVVPGRLPFHVYPTAISMLYHQGSPYVMYTEVQVRTQSMKYYVPYEDIFGPKVLEHTKYNNQLLAEVMRMPLERPQQTRRVPGDDKGMVDIVLIALLLFGANVEGVYCRLFC